MRWISKHLSQWIRDIFLEKLKFLRSLSLCNNLNLSKRNPENIILEVIFVLTFDNLVNVSPSPKNYFNTKKTVANDIGSFSLYKR
jgi:hypothetical protein